MGQSQTAKVSLGQKLAFASADIFGGGSFNIINFLFFPFLTLVVGINPLFVSPILFISKFWDGLIDPFIGKITDARNSNSKFGKRRFFMLISAPIMFVAFVLLFFPWNMLFTSQLVKIIFVIVVYMLYSTAQSFILIPYFSLGSEMTDDYNQRNKVNAVRIAFSILSSLICVAVPSMIASPSKADNGLGYIYMAIIFGAIFAVSVIVTALFAKEQVRTLPIKQKLSLKEFFKPLKLKTYRQYLGMQMCTSMAMAVMSSFFFVFCDFYLRKYTYYAITSQTLGALDTASRFPIATISAVIMFLSQIIALPVNLMLIKRFGKRTTYIVGAIIWATFTLSLLLLPTESLAPTVTQTINNSGGINYHFTSVSGASDLVIMILAFCIGYGLGACVFVPHSSFGDVCNVGELCFGKRTEGSFSGLTNFLNTVAQALGLALPPIALGLCKYTPTQYVTLAEYNSYLTNDLLAVEKLGMALDNFRVIISGGNVQLSPLIQQHSAQVALLLTIVIIPLIIIIFGIIIASKFKLNREKQQKIVELLSNKDSPDYERQREEILKSL
ncbi:MAG: MFS transporter [Clostridia bacterium]